MEPDKNTNEYLDKMKQVRLSDTSRARIMKNLDAYADFHGVRDADANRSTTNTSVIAVWQMLRITNLKRFTMPIYSLIAIVLIGGGTTFAAEGSVPGDLLYPIKVGVTENIKGALTFGAEAEAELQTQLLEERVAEAKQLEAEGRLSGELATKVAAGVQDQATAADRATGEANASVSLASSNQIRLALQSYDTIAGTNLSAKNTVAVAGSQGNDGSTRMAMNETAEADTAVATMSSPPARSGGGVAADAEATTMVALEPISIDQLQANTEARLEALVDLLQRYRAEFEATVYTEYRATLDEATELMVEAETQSEDRARETLFDAADLVGKVEAALTTMGSVKIDTDTGAIIDIDFGASGIFEEPIGDPETMPMGAPEPLEATSGFFEADSATEVTSELNI